MKVVIGFALFAMMGCKVNWNSRAVFPYYEAQNFISVSNFPSLDTASIVFFKTRKWYKVAISKMDHRVIEPPTLCKSCNKHFGNVFMKALNNLQSEKPSNDCVIYVDTLIDGNVVRGTQNFYNISDLQKELVYYKYQERIDSISFFEPRLGLKYCKTNEERKRFIEKVDFLRGVQ